MSRYGANKREFEDNFDELNQMMTAVSTIMIAVNMKWMTMSKMMSRNG